MTNQQKTLLIALGGIVIIAGLVWWANQNQSNRPVSESNEPIKIGFIGPLTGDGVVWSTPEKNAIDLAVAEISAADGINGRILEVIYEDGHCVGKDAVSAAQKLIRVDGVKILLVLCSQEVLPVAPIVEEEKVLLLAAYAMSSRITDAGEYVFRNSYTNIDLARSAAQTIKQQHDRVGIISEISEFATDLRDNFKREFEALGGTVIAADFPQGSKDVRTQLTTILSQQPQAIFLNPNGPPGALAILKQLKELGFTGQLYGNAFGSSKEVQLAEEAQGLIFTSDPVLPDNELKQEFFRKYQERYGSLPDLDYPAAARYDGIYILKQALENVGDDPTKIRDYLYEMPPYTGVLGTYTFDENGDVVGIVPGVNQIKDGQVVPYD